VKALLIVIGHSTDLSFTRTTFCIGTSGYSRFFFAIPNSFERNNKTQEGLPCCAQCAFHIESTLESSTKRIISPKDLEISVSSEACVLPYISGRSQKPVP